MCCPCCQLGLWPRYRLSWVKAPRGKLKRSQEVTCSFSEKNGKFGHCFLKYIEQVASWQAKAPPGLSRYPAGTRRTRKTGAAGAFFTGGVARKTAPVRHPTAGSCAGNAPPALFHRCGYAMLKKHSSFMERSHWVFSTEANNRTECLCTDRLGESWRTISTLHSRELTAQKNPACPAVKSPQRVRPCL